MISLAGQSLPRLVKARAPALHRAATVQASNLLAAAQPSSPRANPVARAGPPPFATAATLLEPSWRASSPLSSGSSDELTLGPRRQFAPPPTCASPAPRAASRSKRARLHTPTHLHHALAAAQARFMYPLPRCTLLSVLSVLGLTPVAPLIRTSTRGSSRTHSLVTHDPCAPLLIARRRRLCDARERPAPGRSARAHRATPSRSRSSGSPRRSRR